MKLHRWYLIALVATLTFFFNVERLDIGQDNLVNIHSSVYVLATVAVILILSVSAFSKMAIYTAIALWLGIYFAMRLSFFDTRPLLGGIHTYVSVTEVTMLAVLVYLTYRLLGCLGDFEQSVEAITLIDTGRKIRPFDEAAEDVNNAVLLSRRHDHPLSVVVVQPDAESVQVHISRSVQEVQRSMMNRYVSSCLARSISDALRRTDLAFEQQKSGSFVILCPETNLDGATIVGEHVRTAAEELGMSVHCGVASLPDHALTFEELVQQAESRITREEKVVAEPTAERIATNGAVGT